MLANIQSLSWFRKAVAALVVVMPFIFISQSLVFPYVSLKGLIFMGVTSALFVWWLIELYQHPEMRPRWTVPMIAFGAFVVIMFLAGIIGVNFEVSFWSTHERVTGIVTWLHAALFIMMLVSVFRERRQWIKLFTASFAASVVAAFITWFGPHGFGGTAFVGSDAGTFGNTSYAGSYLLFHIFIGFFLVREYAKAWARALLALGLIVIVLSPIFFNFDLWNGTFDWSRVGDQPWLVLGQARAAVLVTVWGLLMWFGGWLTYRVRATRTSRVIGWGIIAALIIAMTVFLVGIFVDKSSIQQTFTSAVSGARVVVWDAGFEAFKDRPALGWGPENFDIAFQSYFPSELYLPGYGGEVWFDRAHNIVVEQLVGTGIIGLAAWVFLYAVLFAYVIRGFRKGRVSGKDLWFLITVLSAHIVVNMTVFDTPVTLVPWFMLLGFGYWTVRGETALDHAPISRNLRPWIFIVLGAAAVALFVVACIRPISGGRAVVKFTQAEDAAERDRLLDRAVHTSMGRYGNTIVLAETWVTSVTQSSQQIVGSPAVQGMVVEATQRFEEAFRDQMADAPLSYKTRVSYVQLLMMYRAIGVEERNGESISVLIEQTLREAIQNFPHHPFSYWLLAQHVGMEGRLDEVRNVLDMAKAAGFADYPMTLTLEEALNAQ